MYLAAVPGPLVVKRNTKRKAATANARFDFVLLTFVAEINECATTYFGVLAHTTYPEFFAFE